MKRGQVTTFIIVGILVLTAVVLTIYVNREYIKGIFEQTQSKLALVPMNIKPVEDHIKFCLVDTTNLSEKIILLQGGYFEPENKIGMGAYDVAYWYDEKDISPSLDTIGGEIGKSVGYLLPGCIIDFEDLNYNIEVKKVSPKITIKDNKIISIASAEINIGYKNISYNVNKDYSTSFSSGIKDIYDSAKAIVSAKAGDPNNMDLTLLASLDYDVNFFKFNETMVYTLSDEDLVLNFANRF